MDKKPAGKAAQDNSALNFISADRPISGASGDRLRRSRFARQLAIVLSNWRQHDSLVVGLFGPWGSGKTSIKNMVLEALQEASSAPHVIEFNPWQWAGHEQLTAAFFREIQKEIGQKDGSKEAQKVAKLMKSYGGFLGATSAVLGAVPETVQTVLALLVLVGVSPAFLHRLDPYSPIIAAVVIALTLMTAFLSRSQAVLDAIAKWKEARAELDKKTLLELKSELSQALRNVKRPFLIVIDDLDRLTEREIREVFQVVKANADFPNFVYLLPFQRSAASAFKDLADETGDAFLEKIIQVPFDVPPASRADIDALLSERLNLIFEREIQQQRFNQERWFNIYPSGLRDYFVDLRDVNRFVGSLAFYAELFRSEGLMDVSPVDLVALEVIRVFEPKVYSRIASSKDLLTGTSQPDGHQREIVQKQILGLLDEADLDHRPRLKEILTNLFPNKEWAFGGMTYGSDFHEGWLKELQVCCKETFDRYFQLQIAVGDITQAELETVISAGSDFHRLEAALASFANSDRLMGLLDVLEPNLDRIDLAHLNQFVTTLGGMGERLPEDEPGHLIPNSWTLGRILRRLLLREPSTERRTQVLEDAIKQCKSLSAMVGLVASEASRHKKNEGQTLLVDEKQLDRLQAACVARLRQAAAAETLLQQRDLARLLWIWKTWTDDNEVRAWVKSAIGTPEGLGTILRALTHRSTSQGFGDSFVRISWFIRLSELEEFADASQVEAMANQLKVPSEDIATRRALAAFHEAMQKRRAGEPDNP